MRRNRDLLEGTDGNDRLKAAGRKTDIDGGDGNDVLRGNNRDNRLDGGDGRDKVFGGGGQDRLHGRAGNDNLFGGGGEDNLFGGRGRDEIGGGKGDDDLFGGAGNDNLFAGEGFDILNGGRGRDSFLFAVGNRSDANRDGGRIEDFEIGRDRLVLLDSKERGLQGIESIVVTDDGEGNALLTIFDDDNRNGTDPDLTIILDGLSREDVLNDIEAILGQPFDDVF